MQTEEQITAILVDQDSQKEMFKMADEWVACYLGTLKVQQREGKTVDENLPVLLKQIGITFAQAFNRITHLEIEVTNAKNLALGGTAVETTKQ